ncbi:AsnC family transcriptional regulator [mine drainage metagenome]|uniref:AsnC family transcriptional regulator n=1 Tax=mine drainage metagenome TaxID=410659 RepID=T1CVI8_9ZZZZ
MEIVVDVEITRVPLDASPRRSGSTGDGGVAGSGRTGGSGRTAVDDPTAPPARRGGSWIGPEAGLSPLRLPPIVDRYDQEILRWLRQDSRITNSRLGAAIGLTEGAVRYRISRLLRDGTIRKFTVRTAPLGSEGLVLVRLAPGTAAEVLGRLAAIGSDLFETTGEFDAAVVIERESIEEFNRALDELRSIPGVQGTATLVRLSETPRTPTDRRAASARPRSRPKGGSPTNGRTARPPGRTPRRA